MITSQLIQLIAPSPQFTIITLLVTVLVVYFWFEVSLKLKIAIECPFRVVIAMSLLLLGIPRSTHLNLVSRCLEITVLIANLIIV